MYMTVNFLIDFLCTSALYCLTNKGGGGAGNDPGS